MSRSQIRDLLKDLSRHVMQKIAAALDYSNCLGGWEDLAAQFEETKNEVRAIRAKANKSDCARKLLFQLRRVKPKEPIRKLKRSFSDMMRNDLVLLLKDDLLVGKALEELPGTVIEMLACKLCNSLTCDLAFENMYQLADDFRLDLSALTHLIKTSENVSPTEEVLMILVDRNPKIKISQLADVLRKMHKNDLVLYLE